MKKLLLIFTLVIILSFTLLNVCSSQIPRDKQFHLYVGATIGVWGMLTTDNDNLKPLYSIAWVTAAGAGKEIIYDKWMKLGTPDFKDFGATVIGGFISLGIISVVKGVIHNHKNKKYHILINGV